MLASALVYAAIVTAVAGLLAAIRPVRRVGLGTRRRGLTLAAASVSVAAAGLALPAFESRTTAPVTRLDEFAPAWQFQEVHSLQIAAPPARVFEAIKQVRADEIFLFRALTWIRRGGRRLPPGILHAGSDTPILEVATKGGFIYLADDAPREVVVGAVVAAPPGARGKLTPQRFKQPFPPGFAVAAMNFQVTSDGAGGSIVSTETRVFASDASARRRFAAYWRVIYPGSALIRRMWLRAIERRATR
jgi:hypothetical protein